MRVLVVDDSAVMRQLMVGLLSAQPDTEVIVAPDPIIAWRKMSASPPDVILLDLEMPRMDGMTFLRQIMAQSPTPVVICSGHVHAGTELAFKALENGAVGIVKKPELGLRDFFERSSAQVIEALRSAAAVRGQLPRRSVDRRPPAPNLGATSVLRGAEGLAREALIALGASTGGPEALRVILERLPRQTPPLVVVQHMPVAFTGAFAERLSRSSALEVREARSGDVLRPGLALIARGDRHLLIRRRGSDYVAELDEGPPVSGHRPSVNVLFASVARAAGRFAVGALLTGMGEDGADGLLELRRAGAHTLAQDRATSTIFGMPRAAIERGAALQVLPLEGVPAALLEACHRG